MWVSAHIGVSGNERADKLVKRALKKGDTEMRISISKAEAKSINWENFNQMWQNRWDREKKGRHLYVVQRSVKATRVGSWNRREETVLTRLRLGHTALNMTLKMKVKHQTGLCEGCGEEESVEHVVVNCKTHETHREVMRKKLGELGVRQCTLKGILSMGGRAQIRVLFTFLKDTGVYYRV